MGAKSPAKLKLRRPTYKCDICHRKLLSAQALKTHQYCIHKITAHSNQPAKPVKAKPKKAVTDKSKPKPAPSNDAEEEPKELTTQNVSDVRKIEYECPICNAMFVAYYPAYRHIQKSHCINSRGQKVESTSVELIKPLRVEMCIKCNKRIRANDSHSCFEVPVLNMSGLGMQYVCTGCKQQFTSMQLFDMHVSGLHSDGVESMFFPNINDFLSWKQQMQAKTKVDYLILGKCNSKQTYRCTYLPPSETTSHNDVSHICPSSIVVQEFSKGIQVHFYKRHHGHECPVYACPEKYKKFLITSLMVDKNHQSYDVVYDPKDLYCQFKVLLESIIVEAAKVKVDDLKLMLEKALEMTSILNNYDEEDDTYTYSNKQNLCEEQISKALDNIKSFQMKRKANDEYIDHSDPKKRKEFTPKIVNAFSMASTKEEKKKEVMVEPAMVEQKEVVNKVDVPKNQEVPSPRILKNTQIQSSPSFNDSYKDFVDKNFMTKPLPAENSKPSKPTILKPARRGSPVTMPPTKGLRVRPLSKLVEPSEIEEELAKDSIDVPALDIIKDDTRQSKNIDTPNIGPDITIKKSKDIDKTNNTIKTSKDIDKTNNTVKKSKDIDKTNNTIKTSKDIDKTNNTVKKSKDIDKTNNTIRKSKDIDKTNNTIKKSKDIDTPNIGPDITIKKIVPNENKGEPNSTKESTKQHTKELKVPTMRKENTPRTKPRKQVMKTKIGQFKPSLSPKSSSPKKPESNRSFTRIKPDIEYEVKEQENDCNILILKI